MLSYESYVALWIFYYLLIKLGRALPSLRECCALSPKGSREGVALEAFLEPFDPKKVQMEILYLVAEDLNKNARDRRFKAPFFIGLDPLKDDWNDEYKLKRPCKPKHKCKARR